MCSISIQSKLAFHGLDKEKKNPNHFLRLRRRRRRSCVFSVSTISYSVNIWIELGRSLIVSLSLSVRMEQVPCGLVSPGKGPSKTRWWIKNNWLAPNSNNVSVKEVSGLCRYWTWKYFCYGSRISEWVCSINLWSLNKQCQHSRNPWSQVLTVIEANWKTPKRSVSFHDDLFLASPLEFSFSFMLNCFLFQIGNLSWYN